MRRGRVDRHTTNHQAPLLQRQRRQAMLGVRFMCGLRIADPLAMGMAQVHKRDFIVFHGLGALVWAVLFTPLVVRRDRLAWWS
jgi:membrane protein DedA with SNARE-associated domain